MLQLGSLFVEKRISIASFFLAACQTKTLGTCDVICYRLCTK